MPCEVRAEYMQLSPIECRGCRIVEDQSQSTTRKFVDSSEEHYLLEEHIEQSKPKIKAYDDEKRYFEGMHYLLSTPFRYPPLKWGSRFGTKFERGLLYASFDIVTAMAEKAYYKIAFLRASEAKLGAKTTSYTAFKINVASKQYLDLCKPPFAEDLDKISSKKSYDFSQNLGKEMRKNQVECFKYQSARSLSLGHNLGVFSPKSLQNNKNIESTFESLLCYSTLKIVEFSYKGSKHQSNYVFLSENF